MSCHWHIYCKTCKAQHEFTDGNHAERDMQVFVRHRSAIAGLAPLFREAQSADGLRTYHGCLDPEWFEHHVGHELVPRNEYGQFCGEKCKGCGEAKDTRPVMIGQYLIGDYCFTCEADLARKIKDIVDL